MVLYEAYSLKKVMEVKVLLKALYKRAALCIFRSEMNALVIFNVRNSKEDKEHLGEALYCVSSLCRGMSEFDFFGGDIDEARTIPEYSTPKRVALDKELWLPWVEPNG